MDFILFHFRGHNLPSCQNHPDEGMYRCCWCVFWGNKTSPGSLALEVSASSRHGQRWETRRRQEWWGRSCGQQGPVVGPELESADQVKTCNFKQKTKDVPLHFPDGVVPLSNARSCRFTLTYATLLALNSGFLLLTLFSRLSSLGTLDPDVSL